MATNGASINNQAVQNYVTPQQIEQAELKTAPRVAPKATTVATPTKQRGLVADKFEKAGQQQQLQNIRTESQPGVRKHTPEQAQKLAQQIANSSIATGNAAIIAQPDTKKPEDKKPSSDKDRRVVARMVREGKVDEANAFIRKKIGDAFAQRDIESANKWMQTQQKVRTGKLSLPTPDLIADGQMSTGYARGLSSSAESEDLLNIIASTPGAGSVADARLATFLRNKSGSERMAPPEPTYTARANTPYERATAVASAIAMTGNAPWDGPKLIAA